MDGHPFTTLTIGGGGCQVCRDAPNNIILPCRHRVCEACSRSWGSTALRQWLEFRCGTCQTLIIQLRPIQDLLMAGAIEGLAGPSGGNATPWSSAVSWGKSREGGFSPFGSIKQDSLDQIQQTAQATAGEPREGIHSDFELSMRRDVSRAGIGLPDSWGKESATVSGKRWLTTQQKQEIPPTRANFVQETLRRRASEWDNIPIFVPAREALAENRQGDQQDQQTLPERANAPPVRHHASFSSVGTDPFEGDSEMRSGTYQPSWAQTWSLPQSSSAASHQSARQDYSIPNGDSSLSQSFHLHGPIQPKIAQTSLAPGFLTPQLPSLPTHNDPPPLPPSYGLRDPFLTPTPTRASASRNIFDSPGPSMFQRTEMKAPRALPPSGPPAFVSSPTPQPWPPAGNSAHRSTPIQSQSWRRMATAQSRQQDIPHSDQQHMPNAYHYGAPPAPYPPTRAFPPAAMMQQPPQRPIQPERSDAYNWLTRNGRPTISEVLNTAILPLYKMGTFGGPDQYGVIKITNIPYDVRKNEIISLLGRHTPIVDSLQGCGIHIIMERISAKTMDCFVELESHHSALVARRVFENKREKGQKVKLGERHVDIEVSSQEALMKELFPRARNVDWRGHQPLLRPDSGPVPAPFKGFVTSEEVINTVKHAENPARSPYQRKCLQRTYESMVSTLWKLPWWRTELITLAARDQLFGAAERLMQLLMNHMRKGTSSDLARPLVIDLARAVLHCPGFTERQKFRIRVLAEMRVYEPPHIGYADYWPFLALRRKDEAPEDLVLLYARWMMEASATPAQPAMSPFGHISVAWPQDPGTLTLAQAGEMEWQVVEGLLRKLFL